MRRDCFDEVEVDQLPEDEPLSSKMIEMYQGLAHAVLAQAIEDLGSNDDAVRQSAERFCLSDDPANNAMRMLWLGWIGMSEETFSRAATTRLGWLKRAAA